MASKKRGYFKNLMGSLDSAYQHEKKIKDEFTKSAKGYLKNLTGQDVSDDDIKIMEYIKKGLITSSLPPVLRNMYGLKDFYSNIRKIMDAAKGQTQYADPSNKNQDQTGGLTNSTIDNTSQDPNAEGLHNNAAGIGNNNTSGLGKYSSRLLSAPVSAIGNQLITGVGGDESTQGGSGQDQGGDVPDPFGGGFVGPGGSFPGGTSGNESGESSGAGLQEENTDNTSEDVVGASGTGVTGDNGSAEDEKKYDTRAEIMTYEKYVKDLQEGIVEKYKSDVEYAGKSRDYAYTQADDAYRVAMREADRGFETSQPTYGATAEGLLGAGLAGSGYSDYLAGKAYDARSEERAAARSQMNAMKFAADRDYNESMKEAADNKFYNESNITSSKMEYAQKLKDTFDDRYAVMLENVLNGYYNAATAESILKQYTADGVISDAVISALKNAEKEFLATNKESLIGQYINFISGLDDKSVVTENHMRMWLAENAKGALSENEIDVLVDGCFTNGKFDPDAATKLTKPNIPHVHNFVEGKCECGEKDPNYEPESKPETEPNTGDSDNKGEGEKDAETNKNDRPWYEWLLAPLALPALGIKAIKDLFKGKETTEAPVNADYWETLDIFKNAMNAHDIGNGEEYESILKDMEKYAEQGKVNPIAAGAINKMVNGLVVSSGTFEANNGLRARFQEGDNFTVKLGDNVYRVDSEGPASEEVVAAAKNVFGVPEHVGITSLKEGVVFGYKSDLYVVAHDNVYKIKARDLFGNGDYDKLWKAVYNEALNDLYSRAPTKDEAGAQSGKGTYTTNEQDVDTFHAQGSNSPDLAKYVNSMKGALTDRSKTNEGKNTYTRNLFGDMREGFEKEDDDLSSAAPANLENKLTPTEMTDGAGKHDFETADLVKGAIFKMKNNEGEYSFVSKGVVEDEAIANAVKAAAGDNSGIFWDADNKVMYACVKMSDGSQAVVELQNKKAAGKGNGEIVKDSGKFFDMLYDSYTESQQAEQEQNQQMDQAQKDGLKKAWNAVLNFFKKRENEKIQQDHQFIDPNYGTGGVTDIPDMGIGNIISGSTSGGGNVGQGSGNVPSGGGGSLETPDYDYSKITKIGGNFAAEKGGFLSAEKNADSDLKELKNGDNITVEYDGDKYYVDIKSKITSREHDANKAADQLDIKPGQLFTLSTDKNNVYLRSGDGHIYSLTKRGGATFHGNSFDKLRTAISESTSAGNAENEAPVEKTLTYSDANFHKHVGWGSDPGLDKGDNFTIELNGKLYKVENGEVLKDDDPVVIAAEAAGIYNGEVFAYGDQAYLKRDNKIYEIDTRFFRPKQEEKLVAEITNNGGRGFDDQTTANPYDSKVESFTQTSYNPGDYLKIKDGFGKDQRVEIAAVINDGPIAEATKNDNIIVGQVFEFGTNYYVKRGEGMAFKIREGRLDFDDLKYHLDTFDAAANVTYSANFYAPAVIYGEINNMGQKNHYNVHEGEVGKNHNEIMIPFGDETYIAKVGNKVDSAHRLHDIVAAAGIEYSNEQLPIFVWNGNVYMLYGKKKIVELAFDHPGDKTDVIAVIEGVVKQDNADAEFESQEE